MAEHRGLPADPAELRLLLDARADGELDPATAQALDDRLEAEPALAAAYARIVALRGAVGALPKPAASAAFTARIAAIADAAPTPADPPASARVTPFRRAVRRFETADWRAMAAAILVTAVVASGATRFALERPASGDFAAAVADGHRRSLLSVNTVDVASSDRHTVKPWLDARIGVSPPAPDLAADSYPLVGGRVEVIGDRPLPTLVYRHREHVISLVAAPLTADTAPVTAPVVGSAGGFTTIHWTDGAFSYWAISDTEKSVLDDFVGRFRAAVAAD